MQQLPIHQRHGPKIPEEVDRRQGHDEDWNHFHQAIGYAGGAATQELIRP